MQEERVWSDILAICGGVVFLIGCFCQILGIPNQDLFLGVISIFLCSIWYELRAKR